MMNFNRLKLFKMIFKRIEIIKKVKKSGSDYYPEYSLCYNFESGAGFIGFILIITTVTQSHIIVS